MWALRSRNFVLVQALRRPQETWLGSHPRQLGPLQGGCPPPSAPYSVDPLPGLLTAFQLIQLPTHCSKWLATPGLRSVLQNRETEWQACSVTGLVLSLWCSAICCPRKRKRKILRGPLLGAAALQIVDCGVLLGVLGSMSGKSGRTQGLFHICVVSICKIGQPDGGAIMALKGQTRGRMGSHGPPKLLAVVVCVLCAFAWFSRGKTPRQTGSAGLHRPTIVTSTRIPSRGK